MRLLAPSLLVVVSVAALGSADLAAAQENVRAAVERNNRRFVAAAAKADVAALADMYTATARVFPPNSDVVQGRNAIQGMWKSVFDGGITNVSLTTTDVESQGDLAYESGTYEMKLKDGKTVDRGKYIVVWKRDGGQWKLHRDIWNTSMPAK